MGDLTDMVTRLEADINDTFTANTLPTLTDAVAWLNDGTLLTATLLLPQPGPDGSFTKGRFDKLTALIESEEFVNGVATATVTAGKADLPSTNDVILHYRAIQLGTSTTYYPAKVVNLNEVFLDQIDSVYGAEKTNPICAFSDGILEYSPKAGTGPITQVKYYFVEKPTLMVKTTTEDFPYSKDMMMPVIEFGRWKMWSQNERNQQKAEAAQNAYFNMIKNISGISHQVITHAISQ